jgi:protease I
MKRMSKILFFIDDGVEEIEFQYPYYRFQEDGFEVEGVGAKAKETYIGKHGIPITSDLSPKDVDIDEYDALVIPGGRAPERMRVNKDLVSIVKAAYEKGKVIAAICHGPQILIEADILRNKKATCYKTVSTDLKNAGATFVDESVVVDGNLITSRFPDDLPNFCLKTLNLLKDVQSK